MIRSDLSSAQSPPVRMLGSMCGGMAHGHLGAVGRLAASAETLQLIGQFLSESFPTQKMKGKTWPGILRSLSTRCVRRVQGLIRTIR